MNQLVMLLSDRYFFSRVEEIDGHLIWHGPFKTEVTHRKPVIRKSKPTNQTRSASRYAWELVYPELPENRKLRYTCGNDMCVAPEHQEVIQDTCPKGHEMTDANKYPTKTLTGFMTYTCRTCVKDALRAKRRAAKVQVK